jgi:hypothetical protein
VKITKTESDKQIVQYKEDAQPQHPMHVDKPLRIQMYNPVFKDTSFFKKRFNKLKERFFGSRTVVVNFEHMNGDHSTFLVIEKDGGFQRSGKFYIFDNDAKYYNASFGKWCFDYHENLTMPIKYAVNIAEIVGDVGEVHKGISLFLNPNTVKSFLVAEVAKQVLSAGNILQYLKRIFIVGIISMIILIVFMIMFMIKTGMFQSAKQAVTGG